MRVVFMGTPGFAVGTLKALLEAGHDVAAVVTQPDKPKGRGKELLMTPVKAEAVKHDIPVFQPELSLIHISEPTRRTPISYAVFCLKKKKKQTKHG